MLAIAGRILKAANWTWTPISNTDVARTGLRKTTLYQVIADEPETFLAEIEAHAGSSVPELVKDELEAFLECGILAHGFVRLRCGECAHEKLVAFTCKCRGLCPSCGARRMAETAFPLDRVIPRVPVRQWVLSFPIPLRILFVAHPELLTPSLRIVHRVIARFLVKQTGLKRDAADTGAVTRYELPGPQALNFGIENALGGGVTISLAQDAHGKSLSYVMFDIELPC